MNPLPPSPQRGFETHFRQCRRARRPSWAARAPKNWATQIVDELYYAVYIAVGRPAKSKLARGAIQRSLTRPRLTARRGRLHWGSRRRYCNDRFTEGFRMPALCRGTGPDGAGVRKPRKEETAGRKRRGLVGGELWGFEGRGRIAGAVAGAGGSHSYRWARRRRACSIASIRGPGVSPAPGEGLRTV